MSSMYVRMRWMAGLVGLRASSFLARSDEDCLDPHLAHKGNRPFGTSGTLETFPSCLSANHLAYVCVGSYYSTEYG
ncbi:hypothetical protein GGR54DRAFT_482164 [Hypoxylon sp. NC1633]|nr:hypothetical protein GGR54DRAFT_482164 [Hypoxylon sp. NC1633]